MKAQRSQQQHDPESMFWEWIAECTKPRGWIRYSPQLARALGSDRTALVLSYAIHLDGRGSGYYSAGRWFYKSAREWAKELCIPLKAVERALDILCLDWRPHDIQYSPLPDAKGHVRHPRTKPPTLALLFRWFASKNPESASGIYHYHINWPQLAQWWTNQSSEYGQLPLALKFADVAVQLGQKGQTSMAQKAQLDKPSTFNQYGLDGQTSGEDHAEDGLTGDIEPAAAPASGRADDPLNFHDGTANLSFGEWKETLSAQTIARLFRSEGWEDNTIRDAMYRAYQQGGRYVDVLDSRSRCEAYYKDHPGLNQWPGFFATWFLYGE